MNANLIEKALALTWKTMEWIREDNLIIVSNIIQPKIGDYWIYDWAEIKTDISIVKFYAYLLSPSFIEKYMPILFPFEIISDYEWYLLHTAKDFWEAIYNYQSGDSSKLINLLSKI